MKPNMAMAGASSALIFAGAFALLIPAWAALLAAGGMLLIASMRAGTKQVGSVAELARDWGLSLSSSQTDKIPGSVHGSGGAVAVQEPERPPQRGPLRSTGEGFTTMPEHLQEAVRDASMNPSAILRWNYDESTGKLTVQYGEEEYDSIMLRK